MDTPFRALLFVSLTGALAACPEEASIGKDECLGPRTSCVEPPAQELGMGDALIVRTDALTKLGPVWSRPVELPARPNPAEFFGEHRGQLVGGGPASLWILSPGGDGMSLDVSTIDLAGEITGQTSVAAQEPSSDNYDRYKPYTGPKGAVTFAGASPHNQDSPGPIVRASWTQACRVTGEDFTDRCGYDELLVFGRDTIAPVRRLPERGMGSPVLHARDGGLWSLGYGPLRKYDPKGNVTLEQTLLVGSVANNRTPYVSVSSSFQPAVTFGSGELGIAAFERHGSPPTVYAPELWRFDEEGNALFHAYLFTGPRNMTSMTDSKGNWTLISTSQDGDSEFGRIDRKANRFSDYQRVLKESYADLWVYSATRDSADNIYVLTQTGSRDERTPTVCRLPPEGAVTCYLVPELTAHNIVGGDAGSFYAAVWSSDAAAKLSSESDAVMPVSDELLLQRYEWPEP